MALLVLAIAVLLGAGCGLLLAHALRRTSFKLAGIAIVVSFAAISAGILAARAISADIAVAAGVLAVLTFLAVPVAAGIGMRG